MRVYARDTSLTERVTTTRVLSGRIARRNASTRAKKCDCSDLILDLIKSFSSGFFFVGHCRHSLSAHNTGRLASTSMRGSLGVCDYATRVVLRSATVCGARQSSRPGAHQMAWRASWCSSARFAPRFASPRKTHTTTTPTTRCMATGGNNMDDTRRRQHARAARAVPLKLVMVSKGGGSGMDSVCKEWGDKVGRYTSFSEIVVKSNPKNAKGTRCLSQIQRPPWRPEYG